jgi:cell division protein FtsA
MREQTLAGVDIGTTKTVVAVGQLDREHHLHLRGAAQVPTQGLRRGGITHMDEVANSISVALERCAHVTGVRPLSVYCAITGTHLESHNHRGAVAITPAHRDIDAADIAHVLDVAGAIPLDANRLILAVLPRMYLIDGQDGIKHPLGMAGYRLEADAHIVTGALSAYRNLLKCAERAHVAVDDVVVAALASAEAVLAPGEREQGAACIDLGSGTADVALFADGGVWRTFMLPLGGQLITDDIAYGLRLPAPVAEAVKVQYGTALPERVAPTEMIDLGQFLPHCQEVASRRTLADIIWARATEILTMLRDEIRRGGRERAFAGGVVLTGGTAELAGITELAAQIFDAPVRIGTPHSLYGAAESVMHPAYATAFGLLRWQAQALATTIPGAGGNPFHALWFYIQRLFGHAD